MCGCCCGVDKQCAVAAYSCCLVCAGSFPIMDYVMAPLLTYKPILMLLLTTCVMLLLPT